MRARAKFIVSVGEVMMRMVMTRVDVFGGSEDEDEDADEHAEGLRSCGR